MSSDDERWVDQAAALLALDHTGVLLDAYPEEGVEGAISSEALRHLRRLLARPDRRRTLLTCVLRLAALAGAMGEHSTRLGEEAMQALLPNDDDDGEAKEKR